MTSAAQLRTRSHFFAFGSFMNISERLPEAIRGRIGWILAVLAVLVIVGIIIARRDSQAGGAPAQASALTVTTATLRTIEAARGIVANGSVHPWQEIVVGPEVGGYRVAAVHVDVGDRVKRGHAGTSASTRGSPPPPSTRRARPGPSRPTRGRRSSRASS
jgi:hypothetical protein